MKVEYRGTIKVLIADEGKKITEEEYVELRGLLAQI